MLNQEESSTTIPLNSGNHTELQQGASENGVETNSLFSPRFKSVVAMAGWDEEALLCASLIVEDTPVRNSKQRKRVDLSNLKSPLSTSRRKRRAQRTIGASMPVAVLSLDEDPPAKQGSETEKSVVEAAPTTNIVEDEVKEIGGSDCKSQGSSSVSSSNAVIPCIDRLREELSCAICLDICYEPSTTPCGHSFCKRCLKNAAYKCGRKCPKCRQLISNGRSCTINTVLWNTIQLLFPQEVEARKASDASNGKGQNPARINQESLRNESVVAVLEPVSHGTNRRSSRQNISRRPSDTISRQDDVVRRNSNPPIQDEDAALALRLQREEFMGVFDHHRRSDDAPPQQRSSSLALARANLRAMASRATSIRSLRGRTT